MKPLTSKQVQRGVRLNEWEPAEHHLTMEGLEAFKARQEARRLAAQEKPKADAVTDRGPRAIATGGLTGAPGRTDAASRPTVVQIRKEKK